MTEANSAASTRTSRVIKAPREALYQAFTDPAALAVWLAPGEMTMVVTCEDRDGGTEATIVFEHIPSGIRPEDHEAGCRSSLEKLAPYLE
jgi:hypothetical protein